VHLCDESLTTSICSSRSMEDIDGPMVAKSVYEDIFSSQSEYIEPDDVAYALDTAVQKLRHVDQDSSRWAPYIHLGI
jgi:hypothetical protein